MGPGTLKGLTGTERAVIWELAEYVQKDTNRAWPSVETIRDEVDAHRRTVQRALRRLEELGHIRAEQPGNGRGHLAQYLLAIPGYPMTEDGKGRSPRRPLRRQKGRHPIP